MKDAFINLIGVLGFLAVSLLLMCTVIAIIQLIINKESRNDLKYLINCIARLYTRIKINILQAMLYKIRKALYKAESGTKHENVA